MKIHLSESQVKKLISDYKTINEQSVGFNPETKTETVDFKSVWRAGYWKLTSNQIQNLNNQMRVIQNFLAKNPQTKLTIQVEAGESKVTNADNESGGKAVPEGYLSTKRGESLVNYLNTFFKKLENGGMSFTYPEIPKPKTIVGSKPYSRKNGDNPNDPKYKEEQFVRLKVTATSQSECLIGLEVMIGWIKDKGHSCDQAIFQLLMNKIPLGIANLNNGPFDIKGLPSTLVKPDVLNPVKLRIDNINRGQVTSAIRRETSKFAKWRMDPKNGPSSERKWLDGYKFDGKTIREIGGYSEYIALVKSYYNENKPNQLTYSDNDIFDEDYLKKMVAASKDTAKPISTSQYKYYMKIVPLAVSFKFDAKKIQQPNVDLHNKITNQAGRSSDKVEGGKRTQTFKIDTALAKEIFAKGKGNQNKIILSMVPLVGPSGQFKQYYSTGSHSDVPYVRIKKEGESGSRYSGYPSVSIARGDLSEVTLIETDLCGNPIEKVEK
jgi:hypothetical protein